MCNDDIAEEKENKGLTSAFAESTDDDEEDGMVNEDTDDEAEEPITFAST
jgi:hypothetical protein